MTSKDVIVDITYSEGDLAWLSKATEAIPRLLDVMKAATGLAWSDGIRVEHRQRQIAFRGFFAGRHDQKEGLYVLDCNPFDGHRDNQMFLLRWDGHLSRFLSWNETVEAIRLWLNEGVFLAEKERIQTGGDECLL